MGRSKFSLHYIILLLCLLSELKLVANTSIPGCTNINLVLKKSHSKTAVFLPVVKFILEFSSR